MLDFPIYAYFLYGKLFQLFTFNSWPQKVNKPNAFYFLNKAPFLLVFFEKFPV